MGSKTSRLGCRDPEKINSAFPIVLINQSRRGETAWRYRFADGTSGEIGLIAPVTNAFCGDCSRNRLTADGHIRTCLFSTEEYDVRRLLRSGGSRTEVADLIHLLSQEKHRPYHWFPYIRVCLAVDEFDRRLKILLRI
ncbi:MAG: hypothetical protein IPG22_22715 [Acidobacteria bacterium]|nr:hypothetical protein [Acidobacteriota bacterium]